MQDYTLNVPTRDDRANDMTKFMNGHHAKPTQRQQRSYEQDLLNSIHFLICKVE